MAKVTIIDYGLGNLFSVEQACKNVGLETEITNDNTMIAKAEALILPGVGAFGDAMESLHKQDLVQPIKDFADSGKPFFGVCLGMQLLFTESEEFGSHKGLDIIPGVIAKFPNATSSHPKIKVPQIAWNQIMKPAGRDWLRTPYQELNDGEYMYFVHSYYARPEQSEHSLSLTTYEDIEYSSSVLRNNVFATQFHPEKSADSGLSIYKNWAKTILKN
ncbi:imidazole glycerol phosphate synthase subunit HisH [Rufibacter soli]